MAAMSPTLRDDVLHIGEDGRIKLPSHPILFIPADRYDFIQSRDSIRKKNYSRLVAERNALKQLKLLVELKLKKGELPMPEGDDFPLPEYDFFLLTQKFAEKCLDSLINAIRDLPDPNPAEWAEEVRCSADKVGNNAHFYMCYFEILPFCLCNKAAILYAISRHSEFLPKVFAAMKMSAAVHYNICRLCEIPRICLVADEKGELATDLVKKYHMLDILANCVLEATTAQSFFKDLVPHISSLCYHLAAMGGANVKTAMKKHKLLVLLRKSLDDFPPPRYSAAETLFNLERIEDEFEGTELTLMKAYPLPERIRWCNYIPGYSVYCSLSSCHGKVQQDGILRYCALCRLTRYCNRKCQNRHWDQEFHKLDCPGKMKK